MELSVISRRAGCAGRQTSDGKAGPTNKLTWGPARRTRRACPRDGTERSEVTEFHCSTARNQPRVHSKSAASHKCPAAAFIGWAWPTMLVPQPAQINHCTPSTARRSFRSAMPSRRFGCGTCAAPSSSKIHRCEVLSLCVSLSLTGPVTQSLRSDTRFLGTNTMCRQGKTCRCRGY